MKKLSIYLIGAGLLWGSTIKGQTGNTTIDSIFIGNQYRHYRLYVPLIYTPSAAAPLVLNLHGYASNNQAQQLYTAFDLVADTAGCLIAYPQGTKDLYNNPYWNAGTVANGVDDAEFLNALIDSLSQQYNINPQRIYITGLSNGGFMAQYMACFANQKIAAIASVAGTMFNNWSGSCNPGRTVPVLHIHGTADNVVPYVGNTTMYPVESMISFWINNNNCNSSASSYNFPDTQPNDGCTAQLSEYASCTGNTYTSLIKILNGGHSWPGGTALIDITNYDIHGSAEIWKFFLKHTLSQTLSISRDTLFSPSIHPNPATYFFTITPSHSVTAIFLYDLCGHLILQPTLNNGYVDISLLPDGLYLVGIQEKNNNTFYQKLIKNH